MASDDAVVVGDVAFGGATIEGRPERVRWTGGQFRGVFEVEKITDLLLDQVHSINDVTGLNNWTGGPGDGTARRSDAACRGR